MTKYQLGAYFVDHDTKEGVALAELAVQQNNVANELAEANRLKRIEIYLQGQFSVIPMTVVVAKIYKEADEDRA